MERLSLFTRLKIRKLLIPTLKKVIEIAEKNTHNPKLEKKNREKLIKTIMELQEDFYMQDEKGQAYTEERLEKEKTEELINILKDTLTFAEKSAR